MANYQDLKSRLDHGEVIILDGAIGTELQAMGVPMHPASWCGPGSYTHPATVRQMHERYIRAGADVITTNTFNNLRPALEASGYSELVREVNVRAVDAALDAIARAAVDRPVYIAGSISCRIPIRDRKTGTLLGGTGYGYGTSLSTEELRAYAEEQANILAGVRRGLLADREFVARQRVQGDSHGSGEGHGTTGLGGLYGLNGA